MSRVRTPLPAPHVTPARLKPAPCGAPPGGSAKGPRPLGWFLTRSRSRGARLLRGRRLLAPRTNGAFGQVGQFFALLEVSLNEREPKDSAGRKPNLSNRPPRRASRFRNESRRAENRTSAGFDSRLSAQPDLIRRSSTTTWGSLISGTECALIGCAKGADSGRKANDEVDET
jgi:hypothetical protein